MNRSILYSSIEADKYTDSVSKNCLNLVTDKATEIVCKDWLYPVVKYPVGNEFIDNDEFILGMFIASPKSFKRGLRRMNIFALIPAGLCIMAAINEFRRSDKKAVFIIAELAFGGFLYWCMV